MATKQSTEVTDAPTTTTAAQPRTLAAATEVAQEFADRFTAGDFAGAWDLMSSQVQMGISRADYATFNKQCKTVGLVSIKMVGVRLEGDTTAVIRQEAIGMKSTRTMVFEGGEWRMTPTEDLAEELGKPVDEIIAAETAEGGCKRK